MTTGTSTLRVAFVNFGGGSGDIVVAVALQNAFRRAGVSARVTAFTNNEFESLFSRWIGFERVPAEPKLLFWRDRQTVLYKKLLAFDPEVLIVYGSWVPVLPILDEFDAYRILLIRQAKERWFSVPFRDRESVAINPEDYQLAASIEPGFMRPGFIQFRPVVVRNRDEILSRSDARKALGVAPGEKSVVVARNGYEGEIETLLDRVQRDDPEVRIIRATNRGGRGLFPLADYAKGIDLLVSGGGYSTFYETRFFGIQAELFDFPRNGEDISWRLRNNGEYQFDTNGADELTGHVRSTLGV